MDRSQVKPGMRVTARAPAPDAIVYEVLQVRGFRVRLVYNTDSGQRVEGGWIDCSTLHWHDEPKPAFYAMSLDELSSWVTENNGAGDCEFDDLPATEDLDDDEVRTALEEYEGMAEELWAVMHPDQPKKRLAF